MSLRQAFIQFCPLEHWALPCAVTLTLKQGKKSSFTQADSISLGIDTTRFGGEVWETLDPLKAAQNFRHFMNVLNRQVYGHSYERHQKRIRVIAVLEGSKYKRYHYHALIDCPHPKEFFEFPKLIRDSWQKTHWGYKAIKVDLQADDGWIVYIAKLKDKEDYGSSIDWMNFYNP